MSDRKRSGRRKSRKLSNNKFVRFLQENVKYLVGAALLLLIAPMTGSADFSQMTAFGWCNAAIIGVVHTAVIYRICFSSLAKLPGQEGAILTYADPLVAMLVSVFVMHETITATQILGAVLLLGFTLLNELTTKELPKKIG